MSPARFNPQDCEQVIRRLDAFLDREIPAAESEEIARHLESCPNCGGEASGRRSARARLRAAVDNRTVVPPFLDARIRNNIRASRRPASWIPRWAGAAAALVICTGVFLAYESGYLRFTESSQNAYIASVSQSVSAILRVGLSDHIHCAVFRRLPRNAPTLSELAQKVPPAYRGLLDIVKRKVPDGYRLVIAHECMDQNRRFLHLAMKSDSRLLSLVLTRKGEGESLRSDNLLPALIESGLPFYRARARRFEIAAFESRDHLVYVVSDLPGEGNMNVMLALAPQVREFLDGLPG